MHTVVQHQMATQRMAVPAAAEARGVRAVSTNAATRATVASQGHSSVGKNGSGTGALSVVPAAMYLDRNFVCSFPPLPKGGKTCVRVLRSPAVAQQGAYAAPLPGARVAVR